ncbi:MULTISPECIES: hypothetical protein [unclassified Microcystis]|uniref:hypothetical protein n=2 Tax=unclassified Microcystis TaxID=2643300 RepID=UPI0022C8FFF4|nr:MULTISPECIES: hypothetical protein [unclassified Microcystis]MCA2543360.1 hypothetical protein [Microcystis sp. M55BS1]MCA2561148.1 hypothetical protein [Microcystis sp. M40BS1]MCA2570922.1 hypothetical protein [Microcystis sp. M42BS1]MCA2575522.1 hypothetical protein [Microcystis sp. M41BS1]MCA2581313.1 hypothetical protein [Microcystis sp. M39BS1]MCA2617181.1 hypothetical protein [Microcystis sp. M25BS1]MCZ8222600.1 hypothetical protein [Microcystis sp. LE19-84.1B]MEB3232794.1 hypothet
MMLDAFVMEPYLLPIQDVSISALIQRDQSANRWNLTVIISRAPDQDIIQASEVDAQLLMKEGTQLKQVERPSDALVEAGGSLSSSANAVFSFQNANIIPEHLEVSYRNQTVQFQILPQSSIPEQ